MPISQQIPDSLFIHERMYESRQQQIYMQTLMQQNQQLSGTLARLNSTLSQLQQRGNYLPTSLANVSQVGLGYAPNVAGAPSYLSKPMNLSNMNTVQRMAYRFGGYQPAEPYYTPLETRQLLPSYQQLARTNFRANTIGGLVGGALGSIFLGPIGGTLGAAAGGLLTEKAVSAIAQPAEVGAINRALSGGWVNQNVGVRGPGIPESSRLLTYMKQLSYVDTLLSSKEVLDIFSKISQTNLMTGVRSSEDFKRRFKDYLDSIKKISQNLHITYESSIQLLDELKRMGVGDTSQALTYTNTIRRMSAISGVSTNWLAGQQMGFANQAVSSGTLLGPAALTLGGQIPVLTSIIRNQTGQQLINQAGGEQPTIEALNTVVSNLLGSSNGRALLLGMLRRTENGYTFDTDLLNGRASVDTLLGRTSSLVSSDTNLITPIGQTSAITQAINNSPNNALPAIMTVLGATAQYYKEAGLRTDENAWRYTLNQYGVNPQQAVPLGTAMSKLNYANVGREINMQNVLAEYESKQSEILKQYESPFLRLTKSIQSFFGNIFNSIRDTFWGTGEIQKMQLQIENDPGIQKLNKLIEGEQALVKDLSNSVKKAEDITGSVLEQLFSGLEGLSKETKQKVAEGLQKINGKYISTDLIKYATAKGITDIAQFAGETPEQAAQKAIENLPATFNSIAYAASKGIITSREAEQLKTKAAQLKPANANAVLSQLESQYGSQEAFKYLQSPELLAKTNPDLFLQLSQVKSDFSATESVNKYTEKWGNVIKAKAALGKEAGQLSESALATVYEIAKSTDNWETFRDKLLETGNKEISAWVDSNQLSTLEKRASLNEMFSTHLALRKAISKPELLLDEYAKELQQAQSGLVKQVKKGNRDIRDISEESIKTILSTFSGEDRANAMVFLAKEGKIPTQEDLQSFSPGKVDKQLQAAIDEVLKKQDKYQTLSTAVYGTISPEKVMQALYNSAETAQANLPGPAKEIYDFLRSTSDIKTSTGKDLKSIIMQAASEGFTPVELGRILNTLPSTSMEAPFLKSAMYVNLATGNKESMNQLLDFTTNGVKPIDFWKSTLREMGFSGLDDATSKEGLMRILTSQGTSRLNTGIFNTAGTGTPDVLSSVMFSETGNAFVKEQVTTLTNLDNTLIDLNKTLNELNTTLISMKSDNKTRTPARK